MDAVTLPNRVARLGEKKHFGVRVNRTDGRSLSGATAVILCHDSAGVAVGSFSGSAMTVTGAGPIVAKYLVTFGAGLLITAAGVYRMTYEVTNGGVVQRWQQQVEVKAVPS